MTTYEAVKVPLDPPPYKSACSHVRGRGTFRVQRRVATYEGTVGGAQGAGPDQASARKASSKSTTMSSNSATGGAPTATGWPHGGMRSPHRFITARSTTSAKHPAISSKACQANAKGSPVGFPKFKPRSAVKSFAFSAITIPDDHGIRLPRIGRVHTLRNIHRLVAGRKVKTTTIRCEHDTWYASLLCETPRTGATREHKTRHLVRVHLGTHHPVGRYPDRSAATIPAGVGGVAQGVP